MDLSILYGDTAISVRIPDKNLLFEIGPKEVDIEPQEEHEIERALMNPIGSKTLSDLVESGQRVSVIVDDHTRLTPTAKILPLILDELNRGGVPDQDIQVIIAGGTHRPMTEDERQSKFGAESIARVTFLDHEYFNPDKLLDFGTTERGTHIQVNADAMESDIRITVGVIFPHFPAGWGGGAKMLLPGIAGDDTVAQFHLLGATHADTRLGQVETATRKEMEAFAARVGLHFIFNVVLDPQGRILKAFTGDYIKAHRAGIEFARAIYEVDIPERADLVISNTNPIDHDYFQVMKGLYSAEVCTKQGGEILLVSPIYEGMAVTHREALQVTSLPLDEALSRIRRGEFEDSVAAAIATYQIRLCDTFDISVVSEVLVPEEAEQLGVRLYKSPDEIQEIIDSRIRANPSIQIGVMHQSTEVLPRVRGK
jgi:nickel-dependent lactate racemase